MATYSKINIFFILLFLTTAIVKVWLGLDTNQLVYIL